MPKSIFSTVTSQIPLVNYTDGNRIQMATSMIRQHQDLIDPDIPIISTYNSVINVNSFFSQRALFDGKIVDRTPYYIEIEYNNGDRDFFQIPKYPVFLTTDKEVGSEVKAGELIVYHKSYDDNYKLLKFGKNAHVMFSTKDSYTYEDAIVLSKQGAKKFTSYYYDKITIEIHSEKEFVEFLTDIKPGVILNKGNIIKLSYISNKLATTVYTQNERYVECPHNNFVITDIDVFIKNKKIVEKSKIYSDKFREFIDKYDVDNKYNSTYKEYNKINYAYDSVMFIVIYGYKIHEPEVGDKFANLWGNKGVCSLIEDSIKLSIDKNKYFDIDLVHTPIGVPARMNPSQVIYMNFGYFLKYKIPEIIKDMNINDAFKTIMSIYKYIDPDAYTYTLKLLKHIKEDGNIEKFKIDLINDIKQNGWHIYLSGFTYNIVDRIYEVLKEFNSPIYGKDRSGNNIGFGVIYTMKLEHLVEKKLRCRSLSSYDSKTLQPNKESQRIGEMEMWTIAAYDALNLLKETLTIKADDIENKNKVVKEILLKGNCEIPDKINPKTFDLFISYLKMLGIDISSIDN